MFVYILSMKILLGCVRVCVSLNMPEYTVICVNIPKSAHGLLNRQPYFLHSRGQF